jgi:uncharacterized protein (TIGR02271 family)
MQNIVAFFEDHGDAARAISDLKDAGIRPHQIGISAAEHFRSDADVSSRRGARDVTDRDDKSLWDKISEFFTGSDAVDINDTRRNYTFSDRSWENYSDRIDEGGVLVTVYDADDRSEIESILERHDGVIDRDVEFEPIERSAPVREDFQTEGPRRIQLLSEVLRVNKERVSAGEARIRKEVITENQTIQVPVTREELVIERRPVNEARPASGEIGSESEIRVPLSEERVNVEHQPVVREEVEVGKRQITEERTVSDEVRHEELQVEDETKITPQKSQPSRRKKIA